MIPQRIIEAAIAGGWLAGSFNGDWQEIALDHTFWQALGKELGWIIETDAGEFLNYKAQINRFYECLLTNGDTDAFWEKLLPTKQ